jgi:hypothetical protein
MGLIDLKSSPRAAFLLKALEEKPFLQTFQLLKVILILQLLVPSMLATAGQVFLIQHEYVIDSFASLSALRVLVVAFYSPR